MECLKSKIEELNKLPNIGKTLAEKLCFAGINSPHELKILGSKESFIKLLTFDKTACVNQLYALEGAVKAIRWHKISKEEKQELLNFYNSIKQA